MQEIGGHHLVKYILLPVCWRFSRNNIEFDPKKESLKHFKFDLISIYNTPL